MKFYRYKTHQFINFKHFFYYKYFPIYTYSFNKKFIKVKNKKFTLIKKKFSNLFCYKILLYKLCRSGTINQVPVKKLCRTNKSNFNLFKKSLSKNFTKPQTAEENNFFFKYEIKKLKLFSFFRQFSYKFRENTVKPFQIFHISADLSYLKNIFVMSK